MQNRYSSEEVTERDLIMRMNLLSIVVKRFIFLWSPCRWNVSVVAVASEEKVVDSA